MKKIYMLILLSSTIAMSFAQTFTVNQNSITINGTAAMNTFYDDIPVYNSTASTVQMKWVRIAENMPTPWYTSVCDASTCHDDEVDSAFFNLPANGSNYINMHFYPAGMAGTGTVKVLIYVAGDPSERDTLTFIGNATSTSGIPEADELYFSFSPNPASNNVTVSFGSNISNGGVVEIYNALGQQVIHDIFISGEKNIIVNVGSLPMGYYFMKVTDNKGNSSIKKLVKN